MLFAHYDILGSLEPCLATLATLARCNLFVIIETSKTPHVPETEDHFCGSFD
jgi:hypothetical protein